MKNLILIILGFTLIFCSSSKEYIINAGIGGNTTIDLLQRIDNDVIKKHPDIVLIMVGTNDMLNSKKMITYNDYKINLKKIVKKLKEEDINVILCSPPTVDSVYLFERHDRKLFTETPNLKLDSITQIMSRISIEENLYYIDINSKFKYQNLPSHNLDNYIRNEKNSNARDGVHPTSLGYALIAETIFDFLTEHDLLNKKIRIVCFGDSITYGHGVEGKGTSNGKTYPAILKMKINETFASNVYTK